MKRIALFLFGTALVGLLVAFVPTKVEDNVLSAKEKKAGWTLLFDGKSLNGWKSFKGRQQDGWTVANGELYCKSEEVPKRSDLITSEMYDNYELDFDWKISAQHNSGVVYRCTEDNGATYESGPEFQLIDDLGYPGKLSDKQLSGANYDMHAPTLKVVKPAGEFNNSKIIVNKAHVEHWLNGVKVVEYELWSPEWEATKAISKWKDVKPYGMSKTGYIALQDHGGGIAFKNVKLRKL
ncbi:MAG: DUF1080 domain-containing protein [Chitinophagaceae bacterium]|nr:DUF1080 domain-containing protein [Chitinophagaceae bacterium]